MLKFVENVKFTNFNQMNAVVIPTHISDEKEHIKFAMSFVKANKVVLKGAEALFDILSRTARPETVAIALSDALLTRTIEEQHHFVNSVLGGFKLIADFYQKESDRLDARNIESYKLIDCMINLGKPVCIEPYYKFITILEMDSAVVVECRTLFDNALPDLFSSKPDANVMASIIFTAFRKQHPTHQQSSIRSLMAAFYRLEDLIDQSCLKKKVEHINNYNTSLAYC